MFLTDWIDYLQNLHMRSIDLELGRIQRVAERLSIVQPSCPVITVAGTNGKGSVVAFLEAYYVALGYDVGAYTSPYLTSFNEQFRFNQCWIRDELLCHYFEKIHQARDDIPLTFFEFKTLAALLYFAECQPHILILEVGLGGRLDAVNMIDPHIAVITSISLDHCEELGSTRELIGREKAGIFRPGILAVCGDIDPPQSIEAVANSIGTQVFYRNRDFYIDEQHEYWSWHGKHSVLHELPQPLLLKDNIATALMVIELLGNQLHTVNAERKSHSLLKNLIAHTSVAGRQQILSHHPFIVVDVSHNEDSVRRLVEFLEKNGKKQLTAVFSVLKTKDFSTMASIISPYIMEWHIAEIAHPKAMPVSEIQAILQSYKAIVRIHSSIREAYEFVLAQECRGIIAFGSFHVVGDVLAKQALASFSP